MFKVNIGLPWKKNSFSRGNFCEIFKFRIFCWCHVQNNYTNCWGFYFWPLLWCQDHMIKLKCFSFLKTPVFKIHTGLQGKTILSQGHSSLIFQFVTMLVPWQKKKEKKYRVCPWLGNPQKLYWLYWLYKLLFSKYIWLQTADYL